MATLEGLIKDFETNFLYELQHIPIHAGSDYSGTMSYFSKSAIQQLISEAIRDVNDQIDQKSGFYLENLPDQLEIAVILKTAVLALRSCLDDIKNDSKKVTFLCENKEDVKQMSVTLEEIAKDYEDMYIDTIKDIKARMKSDIVLVRIPETKEDETLIVKIGNEDRPARGEDIKELQGLFNTISKDKKKSFITHHAIEFVVVKTDSLQKATVQ